MPDLGQHVNFRLVDGRVLAPSTAAQRAFACAVLRAARPFELLCFAAADTHAHLEVVGDRASAGELVRRVKVALHQALSPSVPFGPGHFEPIHHQRHLERTFWYVLGQDVHHEYGHDPFKEASNLPDLLGLRVVGGRTALVVRSRLPRVRRGALLETLGLDRLEPAGDLTALAEAAAAAIGVPELCGRRPEVVAARRAAVHVAAQELTSREIADLLEVGVRTVERMRGQEADPRLVRAIGLQLAVRDALRDR